MQATPVFDSPSLLARAGPPTLAAKVRACRPGSACNQRVCTECQKRGMLNRLAGILRHARRVGQRAAPQFVTLTVADVSVRDTRASLQAVMQAARKVFRSFTHAGAHYAAQLAPSVQYTGFVRPHIHGLVWQRPEDSPEWAACWVREIDRTDAGLFAECANVQPAESMEAVARYICRGAIDPAEWDKRMEDLPEVINSLQGLRLFGTVAD